MAIKKTNGKKKVETLIHDEATRKNIPTAEFQSVLQKEAQDPRKVTLPDLPKKRQTALDPQPAWRSKDERDWSDLVVQAQPLYIQEKVHRAAVRGCSKAQIYRHRYVGDKDMAGSEEAIYFGTSSNLLIWISRTQKKTLIISSSRKKGK